MTEQTVAKCLKMFEKFEILSMVPLEMLPLTIKVLQSNDIAGVTKY